MRGVENLSMELTCPIIKCEAESTLEVGECFSHDAKASSVYIQGRLCFDESKAKQADIRYICPFNPYEYMWVNETLQG